MVEEFALWWGLVASVLAGAWAMDIYNGENIKEVASDPIVIVEKVEDKTLQLDWKNTKAKWKS